ncbi:TIGR01459 family HAD-type hydrolase [Pleomorphomonas diazotrophica]|uniref:TIGR01459 family HAD-type hydrolase n=1 Tax=Pleomorphomonas diazotrophica TaxID=1166257 RepID=A0A1I4TUC5_9HYPH|nr:TIGR01459 family HAD-type hydrolase [Pleomorphomonas diazotrophica]PKR87691.1 TIGR01459 family HAD-type hydrolase [Pleomorphomonas diazotrophica]SFM80366.1 HAD-superfamily class IIA hydrolase, TIGR01459 [Pleomorphomonas diazotrophica]
MQQIDMIAGLSSLAEAYDGVICDVWGVLHNGISPYPAAAEALARFRALGKAVVLLTNAPRPAKAVEDLLSRQYAIGPESYDEIVTSGSVARKAFEIEPHRRLFHLGPPHNLGLFEGLDVELVGEDEAEYVALTGLFDDETETADTYRPMFQRFVERGLKVYCANPDVVVERGDRLVYCAGALAQLYVELGGDATIIGKPYKPVYDAALAAIDRALGRPADRRRVLAIGDGLPTDIKGAWGQGIDVLMVTAGIHGPDFGDLLNPDPVRLAKRLEAEGFGIRAAIPRLAW